MRQRKQNRMRATLFVRKVYDKGLEGYWTWELIIFASPPPCHAIANLVAQFRYGDFSEAVKAAERLADLFGLKIDERAYPQKTERG